MPTKIKESWEERFSELFYKEFDEFGFKAIDTTHDDVRDFIRSELSLATSEAKREERERIEKIFTRYEHAYHFDREHLLVSKRLRDAITSSLESSLGDKEKKI